MLTSAARASIKSLLAVWLGYPLVMAGIAAIKRGPVRDASDAEPASDPQAADDGEPMVSVIIATRDDEAVARSRIADCLRCSYPPDKLEVVVAVDRRCQDIAVRYLSRVPDSASPDGRCTVVLGDEPGGKAAALNAGVRAARGEILVFTDTGQRFQPDAIQHLVAALRHPRVGAVSGSLHLPRATGSSPSLIGRYWALESWLRRCEARVHSAVGVSGSIWAIRKSLWSPLPSHLILDDLYTPMRLALGGYRIALAEAARAVETRHSRVGHEYRRKVRTLTGVIQLCAWQPAVLVPLRNPIWLQFVAHKLLRLLTPYWVMAIGAWFGFGSTRWLVANPRVAVGLAPVIAGGTYMRRGIARRLWGVLRCAVVLQAAVVVATVNGVRRRWDVWRV